MAGTTLADYIIFKQFWKHLPLSRQEGIAIRGATSKLPMLIGIGILLSRIEELSSDLDRPIENAGIIISRVGRTAQHRETTEATIRTQFPELVFAQVIKDRNRVSYAAENRMSVFDAGDAYAATEFTNVFAELSKRIGLQP